MVPFLPVAMMSFLFRNSKFINVFYKALHDRKCRMKAKFGVIDLDCALWAEKN